MARGTDKSRWEVRFNAKGDHLSWDGEPTCATVRPATYQFTGVLHVVNWSHGRSSVTITLEDTLGRRYSMTLAEFMRILDDVRDSRVIGTWGFAKNGANTTLLRIDD